MSVLGISADRSAAVAMHVDVLALAERAIPLGTGTGNEKSTGPFSVTKEESSSAAHPDADRTLIVSTSDALLLVVPPLPVFPTPWFGIRNGLVPPSHWVSCTANSVVPLLPFGVLGLNVDSTPTFPVAESFGAGHRSADVLSADPRRPRVALEEYIPMFPV